jgi:uncharacterized protein (TIGR02284 family)
MSDLDTITLLNRLIVTSKNSEAALRAAADEVYHAELHESLAEYSRFFADTASELQAIIERLGGRPKGTGTFDNTLHRTWLHIRSSISGRNEALILDTVEMDEQEADARFDDALTWDIPPDIHALLERRAEGSHERHEQLRQIRQQIESAA